MDTNTKTFSKCTPPAPPPPLPVDAAFGADHFLVAGVSFLDQLDP